MSEVVLEEHMDVSENSGTPKSSILIGLSIINHPFWGTTILETPISSVHFGLFGRQDLSTWGRNSVF